MVQPAITVICPTKRPHMLGRLLVNLQRQVDVEVRAVVCLHGIEPGEADLLEAERLGNVTFLRFAPTTTLGEMLNRGIFEVETPYVCKWDDDDFYGRYFLSESVAALSGGRGSLVGKAAWHAWIESQGKMYLRFPDIVDRYCGYLAGGTLACRTSDWLEIGFPKLNLGEDQAFVRRFVGLGLPVWATSSFNYVQVRGGPGSDHAWDITDEAYVMGATLVADHLNLALIDRKFPA